MTRQSAITVLAPVRADAIVTLAALLEEAGADPAANTIIPFGRLPTVHFARMFIVPAEEGDDGRVFPARLALFVDCDGGAGRQLRSLVRVGGQGLDALLECCEGYPEPGARSFDSRLAYLERQRIPAAASYVNTVGRTVTQVRAEDHLRDEIEGYLDSRAGQWDGMTAVDARAAIVAYVSDREDLRWALKRAPGRSPLEFGRDALNILVSGALILLAVPLIVFGALPFVFTLRRRERQDPAPRVKPDDAHVERLAAVEDLYAHNQFTAAGQLKPGKFRMYTAVVLLWLINLGVRHRYNRGELSGVRTIHFARWVFIDDRARLLFASNYDGSLENYMDDFIDKVAWGLNAVFSNGKNYPRTDWLVKRGASDELAFKSYIRAHQLPTPVWYSAYPHLTAVNIANSAEIRAGLSGEMDEETAARWLRRL